MTLFGYAAIITAVGIFTFLANYHRRQPGVHNVSNVHLHVTGLNGDELGKQLTEIVKKASAKQQ